MLILPLFIYVLIISVCLVKASFWIFFQKFAISKVKSGKTPKYIIVYRKRLKRLIYGRISIVFSISQIILSIY